MRGKPSLPASSEASKFRLVPLESVLLFADRNREFRRNPLVPQPGVAHSVAVFSKPNIDSLGV